MHTKLHELLVVVKCTVAKDDNLTLPRCIVHSIPTAITFIKDPDH